MNLSFGLSSSDSEKFAPQILRFSDEVNGQGPFMSQKSARNASKLPEDEGEKPKTQVNLPVAMIRGVSLKYGNVIALEGIDLDIPSGCTVGIIGSDGVGKSSLLSLISGSRAIQTGKIELFGGDMSDFQHRERVCSRMAYMPQGLANNLYSNLSVEENVNFFGGLFGLNSQERAQSIDNLLHATGLAPFKDRLESKLSGGMKQKLAICCALIHEPDLLILDEPTTGIDPLSRLQFWEMITSIHDTRPGMSILVATAYMEEAARFDSLIAMHGGRILFTGKVEEFLEKSGSRTMEEAFIATLPESELKAYTPTVMIPYPTQIAPETIIEANNLTMRFGDFTAVNQVNFQIKRGEIFGFLGPNGCGKSTTMKMLTGLLPPTQGQSKLFGHVLDPHDVATRKRIGYMSQAFSLYTELTVKQNLVLHARLFDIPEEQIEEKITQIVHRFGLDEEIDFLPQTIAPGQRQRLSLAVAMLPTPEILILDEPTSGVDPLARDAFWQIMMELSRKDKVTIFISTHFMNEAERCDRVSLMHAGNVLATASPAELIKQSNADTLEEAFIKMLKDARPHPTHPFRLTHPVASLDLETKPRAFSLQRMASYMQREARELCRDSTRLTFAFIGSIILMLAFGFGISVDVEHLSFAVLDRDQTNISQDYISNLAGSRYFIQRPPIKDYEDLDARMRSGDISLAIEIPPGFAQNLRRGKLVSMGTWIDGAMPRRAEIIQSYVQGMNQNWQANSARRWVKAPQEPLSIETRYLYNPDVSSQKAMVPASFAIVLMMIPAMLSALSVVREKELGTIINLYVSPTTRLEFLIGKQIPYIVLAMASFLLMLIVAYLVFDISLTGHFLTFLFGTLLFVTIATAIGQLISTFTRSQTTAIFATGVLTLVPTLNFSGLLDPISSLEGLGAFTAHIFPTTFYLELARGVFLKELSLQNLVMLLLPLLLMIPLLLGFSALFLSKQEH